LRNIFDQYEQPENRLTHALVTTLDQERGLLIHFLDWLGVKCVPNKNYIRISQQQVPGVVQDDADVLVKKGLPDAAIFDQAGFAVLFECKVQAKVDLDQLSRHRSTARRNGYEAPWVVVISVDELDVQFPAQTIAITWREVFFWFNQRSEQCLRAKQLVGFMKTFERKMLALISRSNSETFGGDARRQGRGQERRTGPGQ
jgi:hypothetical protein